MRGGPTLAATVVLHTGGRRPRLLWMKRGARGSLAGFHAFPGGAVEAVDRSLPASGEDVALEVAALRELFEEVGVLWADGADHLSDDHRGALRQAFRRDPQAGAALFRELGLRFRTADVRAIGRWVTPESGLPIRRYDTHFFSVDVGAALPLAPDGDEAEEAEWLSAAEALGRWGRGEVLVAPPVVSVLRNATETFDGVAMTAAARTAADALPEYEVVPGLVMLPVRTPTLPPATHTNCYLVGDSAAVLIEPASPYPEEIERIVRMVEGRRAAGGEVVAILATHHHVDHIGGAVALKERLGLPLYGHAATAERLRGQVTFDRLLEDGERLALGGAGEMVLEAVHTPGHAPGHLCFVDTRSGAMIAGDMVAGVGSILVEPVDGDMAVYLDSLRAMAARAPSMLLPAHGGPIQAAVAKVEEYVEHRLMREEKVWAALRDACLGSSPDRAFTPADLVPRAYDDAPVAVHPIAALAAEAHLIKLEADGRVTSVRGVWRVVAPP